MQSHTGTSGSYVIVKIEGKKNFVENLIKGLVFSDDLNFWMKSVCLSSEGKEFPVVGAAKENERCPNVFVRSLWIHRILLSEEERGFLLGVYTESNSDK